MVNKIQKALAKLSAKELVIVEQLLILLNNNEIEGLDIKQLKGNRSIFRVRKGRIRIIFTKNDQNEINILLISKRSEKTYKDY